MWLNYFLQRMVVEIIFNNEIQIFWFPNWFTFLKGKNKCVYIIERTLSLNFNLVIWTIFQ